MTPQNVRITKDPKTDPLHRDANKPVLELRANGDMYKGDVKGIQRENIYMKGQYREKLLYIDWT